MTAKKWTREEKVYLAGMHYLGELPIPELAKDLNRTHGAVQARLNIMKKNGEYHDCVDQWLRES